MIFFLLKVASHTVDGAVEAVEVAAIITKEVFNPIAKLTKGFQNVVLAKGQNQQRAEPVTNSVFLFLQIKLKILINLNLFLNT